MFMNRNIGFSKETIDRVKLAKKYIESKSEVKQDRYTKIIENQIRNTENWRKVIYSMENYNLSKIHQLQITQKICKQQTIVKRLQREKDCLENYQLFNIIGRGAFGEVRLAKNIFTNQLVAIKRLQKTQLVRKKQLYNAYLQRDFLVDSKCTFLVQMKSAFQDSEYLYIAMEYAAGGDLLHLLIQKDIFTEQETKFYIAEMVSAVEEIHKMNYIHRDIKPDNILLDAQGHVKISDFGLSKYLQKRKDGRPTLTKIEKLNKHMNLKNRQSKAFSKVGTPDYISPQVLTQDYYDHSIDIWGIGVLMFECLFGYPPFSDEEPKQVCYKVINWKSFLQFPSEIKISYQAKSIILGLVTQRNKRLSISEIKAHPFFTGIDWQNLREMRPPFIPSLTSETDVANFDTFQIEVPWTDLEKKTFGHSRKKTSSLECNFKFAGFDFTKVHEDPLEVMKKSIEQNVLTKRKFQKDLLKDKKRLKTEESSKREDKFLKNTLSFIRSTQKQNFPKSSKKVGCLRKQKKEKSSKSKQKQSSKTSKVYFQFPSKRN